MSATEHARPYLDGEVQTWGSFLMYDKRYHRARERGEKKLKSTFKNKCKKN